MEGVWLDARVRWQPRSLVHCALTGADLLAATAVVGTTVAAYAVAISTPSLGDAPLFVLAMPMTFAAFMFGVRGAVASTMLGSVFATAWWMQRGYPGGWSWELSRIVTYVLLGVALGELVESRNRLLGRIAQHARLSPDLIATATFDGYFTAVNPAFTHVLGYSEAELTSLPILDLVHPDDRAATRAWLRRQIETGRETRHFENRCRHRDGTFLWLEWSSHPDAATRTLATVGRDISDRKQLELREHAYQEQLEHAVDARTAELATRNSELEEARREMLRRLALVAEYRDDDTFRHTERIGHAAAQLAHRLGLPEEMVDLIREAAPLHDIGKLGISDTILLKSGRLDDEEIDQVRKHPQIGAAILQGSDFDVLILAEQIAASHHEWWNGHGYPTGLHGEEIPLAARIVAIVDVFDALAHVRPYKQAWPVEQALTEIERLRGIQFDPEIVDAFMQLDHESLLDPSGSFRHRRSCDASPAHCFSGAARASW